MSDIILTVPSRGRRFEGIVEGTPLPGTVLQLKAGGTVVGGRNTYEVYNKASSGDRGEIIVLNYDYLLGRDENTAHVTGERGMLYVPAIGEELNMRVAVAGTGTGDAVAVGDTFMIQDGTGLLIAASSSDSEPFVATEAVDDVVATGTLVRVRFTGY